MDIKSLFKRRSKYQKLREKYKDFTMIPPDIFIDNIRLSENFKGTQGCIVECGVWKGGMISAMGEILGDRKYYLFDSFEGLPPAREIDGDSAIAWQNDKNGGFYFDNCSADESYAIEAMKLAGISNYEIVKGWFENTLPKIKLSEPIAILRLDADWYESTLICLDTLFPQVVEGGIILIDDYYFWDGCARAVHEYLSRERLPFRIRSSENGVCYIIKKANAPIS